MLKTGVAETSPKLHFPNMAQPQNGKIIFSTHGTVENEMNCISWPVYHKFTVWWWGLKL